MFNSPVIDLVILLSFTYFIGSLILSAINEAIAGGLRLRPKQLKSALESMLFGKDWKPFVKNHLAKSPHLQSLMKRDGRYPAYIPAKTIVHAIVEQFRKAECDQVQYRVGFIFSSLKSDKLLIPQCLKEILLDFARQVEAIHPEDKTPPGTCNKQIEEFERRIEEFYDSFMERAGGWYKRKTRTILLILAIALSFTLNIDTIKIINDALADKQKLSRAVDNISANMKDLENLRSITVNDSSIVVTSGDIGQTGADINKLRIVYEETSGYFLGYDHMLEEWEADFFLKLIGILITAFALQLGSNYWFDLMNKAVNIRAAGKRPDEKRSPQV